MRKTRFMKFYHYGLLPLYLLLCSWQLITYILNYGLPNVSLLSYLIVYALLFLPFFLPQVIYFKKRKDMFEDWWDL